MSRVSPSGRAGWLAAGLAVLGACSAPGPDVALVSLDQLKAEVAARKGKGLLINHWATW